APQAPRRHQQQRSREQGERPARVQHLGGQDLADRAQALGDPREDRREQIHDAHRGDGERKQRAHHGGLHRRRETGAQPGVARRPDAPRSSIGAGGRGSVSTMGAQGLRVAAGAARRAALLLVAFAVSIRSAEAASGATLLVPAVPDTFPRESEPAPFLVPGRPMAVDTTQTREARARAFLAMAQQLEQRGQLSTALAAYNSALVLDTTLTGVAFHVGRIYQSMEDPERAARAFAQELRRDSTNAAAAIELGISLAQMGRGASAIARLERLTKRVPNDDQAWSALGFAYHAAGRARA